MNASTSNSASATSPSASVDAGTLSDEPFGDETLGDETDRPGYPYPFPHPYAAPNGYPSQYSFRDNGFGPALSAADRSWLARLSMVLLLGLVCLCVSAILLAPVALSSRDLLDWAAAPSGLGLPVPWPVLVILSLDAAAIACVLMSVLSTWREEKPGIFGFLVWIFAITSAFANWRHGIAPAAPPDRFWFIPLMSLTGPGVLEVVLYRARRWITADRRSSGAGLPARPPLGSSLGTPFDPDVTWQRWIPGLGSFTDTFGAYRIRLLTPGLDSFSKAVTAYRSLCPGGSIRVAAALRRRHLAEAQARLQEALTTPPPGQDDASTRLPVDLMKRIPIQEQAYQRWTTAWADLHGRDDLDGAQLREIAGRHGFSTRQIDFIRRAGQAGFLDSAIPPAARLAQAARDDRTRSDRIT